MVLVSYPDPNVRNEDHRYSMTSHTKASAMIIVTSIWVWVRDYFWTEIPDGMRITKLNYTDTFMKVHVLVYMIPFCQIYHLQFLRKPLFDHDSFTNSICSYMQSIT